MQNEDCYRLLNISPDADEKTIRKAYRNRSRELHPDVNPSPDAAAQFAKLSEAVNTLLDPINRLKHDDRFGYHKKARSQDENAKQEFSEYQKEKASTLVNEWSQDYAKAMEMRERQRQKTIVAYRYKVALVSISILFIVFLLILAIRWLKGLASLAD